MADVHLGSSDLAAPAQFTANPDGTSRVVVGGVTLTMSAEESRQYRDLLSPKVEVNRFAGEAKTAADTLLDDAAQHSAVLAKYGRLLVYPPSFDKHLGWYPGNRCWAYHNLIRTQDPNMPTLDWMNSYVGSWRAADIRTTKWQDWWITKAKALAAQGYMLRLDDINPNEPLAGTTTLGKTPSWWVYETANFLERIRRELPGVTLLGNISRWWTWNLPNPSADLLRCIRALTEVEMERGFNDPNLTATQRTTTLLGDWHGLMKRENKGWVHFVQQGTLDYAKGWFDQVNTKWYPNHDSPGWLMTNDMKAGLTWPGAVIQ